MRATPFFMIALLAFLFACSPGREDDRPTVGFVDAFEDDTIEKAKEGFLDALAEAGFSEAEGTIRLIYRNAQSDIPTLSQIVNYMISQEVDLMATNPTLSTVTALQRTKEIPVFMMTSPTPQLMKLLDEQGQAPSNLYGVGENLDYIDTSFALIPRLLPADGRPLRVGLLYNQAEPQSTDALQRLQELAGQLEVELVPKPVSSSADVQLVTAALLNEGIDAFFANPDNTVFTAFETIVKACDEAGVPVFTSEAGLVARGALAAYGADLYEWGRQAGRQAARYLESGSLEGMDWQLVENHRHMVNPEVAERFGIAVPEHYLPITE